jgi:hypothetical protein
VALFKAGFIMNATRPHMKGRVTEVTLAGTRQPRACSVCGADSVKKTKRAGRSPDNCTARAFLADGADRIASVSA